MANTTTETAAKQLLVEAGRDYDRMVRDPLYRVYGGEASSAGRADYVRRRLDELLVWNRGRGEEVLAPIRAAWLAVQS
jgi:hypothetical protein